MIVTLQRRGFDQYPNVTRIIPLHRKISGVVALNRQSSIFLMNLWAPLEIFPEGGKITDTLNSRHVFGVPYKHRPFFGAPKAQTKIFALFRDPLDQYKG